MILEEEVTPETAEDNDPGAEAEEQADPTPEEKE